MSDLIRSTRTATFSRRYIRNHLRTSTRPFEIDMTVIERTTRAFSHGGPSRYVALCRADHAPPCIYARNRSPTKLSVLQPIYYAWLSSMRQLKVSSQFPARVLQIRCSFRSRDDRLRRDIKVIYSLVINMDIELMLYLTEKGKQKEKIQLGIITQRAIMNYNIIWTSCILYYITEPFIIIIYDVFVLLFI